MSYADDLFTYNGVDMPLRNVPDPFVQALAGYGHFPQDIAHRPTHPAPSGRTWPYTPQTCLTDRYQGRGEWLNEATLVCPGCGMDFT